jgi:hypothetical protein
MRNNIKLKKTLYFLKNENLIKELIIKKWQYIQMNKFSPDD